MNLYSFINLTGRVSGIIDRQHRINLYPVTFTPYIYLCDCGRLGLGPSVVLKQNSTEDMVKSKQVQEEMDVLVSREMPIKNTVPCIKHSETDLLYVVCNFIF